MRFLREFEVISADVSVLEDDEIGAVALGQIKFRIGQDTWEYQELIGPDGSVAASTGAEFDVADGDSNRALQRAGAAGIDIRNVMQTEVQNILLRDPQLLHRVEKTFA